MITRSYLNDGTNDQARVAEMETYFLIVVSLLSLISS